MQMQVDVPDAEHGKHQKNAHHDHQDIRLAGLGDVERQMMRRHRMKLLSHYPSPAVDLPVSADCAAFG
jgi:hypothetical protein